MTLWGVFKDCRGVAYCEPVNLGINVHVKHVPERKAVYHWLTRKLVKPAESEKKLLRVQFDEEFYPRKDYTESAFEHPGPDYYFDTRIRYLKENRWGPVKIIVFVKDDKIGRRVQYELRKLAPERDLYDLSRRDMDAKPHPDADRIIKR